MDKELEETLQFARLLSIKLRGKTPADGFAKEYIIAMRCIVDAVVETVEELVVKEAEDDVSSDH